MLSEPVLIVNFEERTVQVFTNYGVAPERREFLLSRTGERRRPECALQNPRRSPAVVILVELGNERAKLA
jgi:hypothetical protein